ncbi:MAG: geranylgeranylglycerol-phosphate geranylgeranyltransferase [Candidatus Thermoplasmatota archaeon]|nr:geranylgeranylglycerol-phosphate geranylgeranyltransferase [Candidatus Thermoplasmatota archaeon]
MRTAFETTMRMDPRIAVLRPLNGSMAAAAVMIGSIIDNGQGLFQDAAAVVLLSLSAFMMAGGANILNDLQDADIDRKAHPKRPLASGNLSEKDARTMLVALWSGGILSACAASFIIRALLPMLIVLISLALMVLYEKHLKRRGLPGNLIVGLLTGAPFLLGASAGEFSLFILAIFLMAFLSNTSREIMKDIQDMGTDRGLRSTLPLKKGRPFAFRVGAAFMLLGALSSFVPIMLHGWDMVYLIGVCTADAVLMISIIYLASDPLKAQWIAKLGMLCAMAVFAVWSLG